MPLDDLTDHFRKRMKNNNNLLNYWLLQLYCSGLDLSH